MNTSTPIIEARDLTVGYGSYVVQKDLNFTINRQDVFIIMGPSGCGKSTLLRVLVGLLQQGPEIGLRPLDLLHGAPDEGCIHEYHVLLPLRRPLLLFLQHALPSPVLSAHARALCFSFYITRAADSRTFPSPTFPMNWKIYLHPLKNCGKIEKESFYR